MLVTRADDIASILASDHLFRVPFGPEMASLANGATFLLGLEETAHERQRQLLLMILRRDDVSKLETLAHQFADALLDAGRGRIDAQQDLVERIAVETCSNYFGIAIEDPAQFAQWTIACSQFLFADPLGNAVASEMAHLASANIGAAIDRSVADALAGQIDVESAETLLARLVKIHLAAGENAPSLEEIRAILLGLAVGFVPTNSMAGGKILDLLSRNASARAEAIDAARAGDAGHFERVLREAMRLAPAIAPGQWRWTEQSGTWQSCTGRTYTIDRHTLVLVATQAGLRDPRRVSRFWRFESNRTDTPPFVFGNHVHSCLGEHVALALLRGCLMPLLARDGVEKSLRRLRVGWLGAFPQRASISYEDDEACQAGQFIVIEAAEGNTAAINAQVAAIETELAKLRPLLEAQGRIHFCSIAAIDAPTMSVPAASGDNRQTDTLLIVEINGDGDGRRAITVLANCLDRHLRKVLALMGRNPGEDLASFLLSHRLPLTSYPWGATALQFYGHQGLSVRDIARQDELARIASEALRATLEETIGLYANASVVLRTVRRRIMHGPDGARWRAYLLKPAGNQMDLSWWNDPFDSGYLLRLLSTRAVRRSIAVVLAFSLLYAFSIAASEGFVWRGIASIPRLIWLELGGLAVSLTALLALIAAFLGILRYKEARDIPDGRGPSHEHLRNCIAREDRPGHVHNHMLIVTALKKGWFRRFTLALALWGIATIVAFRYRPGFVLNMGTIHFARWVRLPGRDTMVFQSNYDGSWESYLEDFITRAHWGQSAAWSNGEGFPQTRFLISKGAEDGDNFKRYVRRKQIPAPFWYARFPGLTNAIMRRNALIHDGLARARSESEARTWLALFGSAQLTQDRIEADEVQSLVFSGFGKLPCARALLLRFEGELGESRAWLRNLAGFHIPEPWKQALTEESGPRETRRGRVTFGEAERRKSATTLGVTAAGLQALGMSDSHPERGINALPGPFAMGMASRARRLGDLGAEAPEHWHWRDSGEAAVHAILVIHASDGEELEDLVALHRRFARRANVTIVTEQSTDTLAANGEVYEHFGFRDGITQPIIAGTARAARHKIASDIVPPGEFVLGYANAQGYLTPGIAVDATDDPHHRLPEMPRAAQRFPRFGTSALHEGPRDFGRNGTFLALRQLEQDVPLFKATTEACAADIRTRYPELESLLGYDIDADWIAARLVGRWQNGASLLGNGLPPARKGPEMPMMFGNEDPAGLQCPLGAHVRRANPRDSMEPGDQTEVAIVNRHRLIRRGRNYTQGSAGHGTCERGLLFMAVCEDLERQFEFVQRTWLDSPAFHELGGQNDPLVGRCPEGAVRSFEIPTSSGPVHVRNLPQFTKLRAGGYFFLPSRSALLWLAGG